MEWESEATVAEDKGTHILSTPAAVLIIPSGDLKRVKACISAIERVGSVSCAVKDDYLHENMQVLFPLATDLVHLQRRADGVQVTRDPEHLLRPATDFCPNFTLTPASIS